MTNLNQKMNTVLTALNERLAERSELLRDMAVALLTGSNLFILGQNGQAKSAAVRLFADCLKDSRFFAYQFNNETDEEKLFGRLDMSSLIPGGVASDVLESDQAYVQMRDALKALYEDYKKVPTQETLLQMSQQRKVLAEMRSVLASLYGSTPSLLTRGKIPEADIVMLDELFKANGGVLHSLLTALNERLYANEGRELQLPTISFFGASNEMPNPYDPEERKYLPLLDRFDLKVKTEYIQDRGQRLALLGKKETDEYNAPLKTQLTMDELGKMQKEVKMVTVSKELDMVMDGVMYAMRAAGYPISDRKFLGYHRIVKAYAWLDGRQTADKTDLLKLINYLWMEPSDIPGIKEILEAHCLDRTDIEVGKLREQYLASYHAFQNDRANGCTVEGIIKPRRELVEAYKAAVLLKDEAHGAEQAKITNLLEEMEEKNRIAHEGTTLTHLPLSELALLNDL